MFLFRVYGLGVQGPGDLVIARITHKSPSLIYLLRHPAPARSTPMDTLRSGPSVQCLGVLGSGLLMLN